MGKKIYEEERKEIFTEFIAEINCDLCGKKISSHFLGRKFGRYPTIELEPEEGKPVIGMIIEDYQDYEISDRSVTAEIYDVCKECYESKVKPILKKELGLEPRLIESE